MRKRRDPLAVRWYRRALIVLPRPFRQQRGEAMVAMLADGWTAERGVARIVLLVRALLDLAWTAVAERVGSPRERRSGWVGMARWMVSWLDFKLGFRMLVRYPGLTVVGGLAMAFALCIGTAGFEILTQMVRPDLPLDDGERVVGIRTVDLRTGDAGPTLGSDFLVWREELESVRELGAFRTVERNLITSEGRSDPVPVAEISASAFSLARVPPLMGRALVDDDEEIGAAPVVVIGHDVWQERFAGAADVVGTAVRLGAERHTVVGVMPEGFGFPVAHSFWVPLRLEAGAASPVRARPIRVSVFGRLTPDASIGDARPELETLGRRAAADFPETHQHVRPQVLPYAKMISDPGEASLGAMAVNVFLVMLLVLICGNVALLMFARAATREGEIVVRSALGASRSRIVGQLFVEALVLGGVAAGVGLFGASLAVRWVLDVLSAEAGGRLPFWFDSGLTPTTVAYAGLLAIFGAVVAGVAPALKVTGPGGAARLRDASAGAGGLRFGGMWTAVMVAQVAVTVAFPATAFFVRRSVVQLQTVEVGFEAERYLSFRLEMDDATPPESAIPSPSTAVPPRFDGAFDELWERLEAEAAVGAVTFTDRLPRTYHPQRWIEVEHLGNAPDSLPLHRVGSAAVAVDYFQALGSNVRSGRGFHSGDPAADPGVVIVNRSFVDGILGGRNPLGRRIREAVPSDRAPGPWREIVGVVDDLGMIAGDADPTDDPGFYEPVRPGVSNPVYGIAAIAGAPEEMVPRLRALAAEVDPTLRLHEVLPLDRVGATLWMEFAFLFKLLTVVSGVALLLSLAGIYSAMSFAVSRRTREIGVRVALGADALRVVLAVFRGPLAQVGAGVAAGAVLVGFLAHQALVGLGAAEVVAVIAYSGLMMAVCLLACIVPTRRALAIEPSDALRAD